MKTLLRGIIAASVLFMLAGPVFAGGAREVDFLDEFEGALQENGLSEDEAQAIAEAARSYDWSGANAADPDVVAEAVIRAGDDGTTLTPNENAELALELARNTVSETARAQARERTTTSGNNEDATGGAGDTPAGDQTPADPGKGAAEGGNR